MFALKILSDVDGDVRINILIFFLEKSRFINLKENFCSSNLYQDFQKCKLKN